MSSINHGGEYYRGVHYHVESADNPHFTNPFPAYSGPAREIDLATGSQGALLAGILKLSMQNSSNTDDRISRRILHRSRSKVAPLLPEGVSQGQVGLAGRGRAAPVSVRYHSYRQ